MYKCGVEEIDAIAAVLKTGQMFRYRGGEGGQANMLEERLCKMLDCKYSLGVTSGTAALICGLVGLCVGPGDEVIVPAYTWLASAGAVLSVGAIPVLAEIDESLMLSPEDLENKIGPQTKAVIPVHMAGHPVDMDRIMAVASKYGVKVLEDTCQAIGGSYKGRRLGTIGDAGAFSFNQFKILSCGEGGAFFTSDRKVYERALYYHDMGCTFRSHSGELQEESFMGNTYRMNEIQGAMMNVQFDRLDGILDNLRERRNWIRAVVEAEDSPLTMSPVSDNDGDCGCNLTFIFNSSEERKKVVEALTALSSGKYSMSSPIDSGLHVYTNWKVFLEKRASHHPALNPFLMKENEKCRRDLNENCCPETLKILDRTGSIGIMLDAAKEDCEEMGRALCQAAREAIKGVNA